MRSTCVLLLVATFVFTSRAQSNTDLVGVWAVDFQSTLENMSGNEKAGYDSLSARARTNFSNTFSSRTFEFKSDSRITISFPTVGGTKTAEGSWRYNSNEKMLSIEAGGISRDFVVQWLNANSIFLKYQRADKGSLLKSLYLDRQ